MTARRATRTRLTAGAVALAALAALTLPSTAADGRSEPVSAARTSAAAAPAPDVVGSWSLSHGSAFSPNARQYGVFLSFSPSGRVQAVDGCLAYAARWKAGAAGRIVVQRWRVTQRDCLGRGRGADQPLVKAFAGSLKVRVRDGRTARLVVTDAAGRKRSLRRIGEPGAMILLPGLFWVAGEVEGSPRLTLADGTFSADSGCGLTFSGTLAEADPMSRLLSVAVASGRCPSWDSAALARVLPVAPDRLVGAQMLATAMSRGGRLQLSMP